MKKLVALLLAVLMLCSVTGALAVEFNAPGTYPICKEKVSLTVAVADNVKIKDYETNMMTLLMEEEVGVDLSFQVYPSTDFNTKVNIMVMSGDALPDIIIGNFNNAEVYAWAQEGALAPLTAYYNDPAIAYELHKAVVRTNNNFFTQMVMPDGEIYAIPALNQSYGNEFPDKYFLFQPWMDKLNLKTPTTTDELYNVLKTIVTSDPNGNGVADEVGIAGYKGINGQWFGYLMNSFIYNNDKLNFLNVGEDGKLYYAYTTDAWREGLRYIKKLFDEKIIAVESLTQDEQQWKSMINTTDVTVASLMWTSTSQITTTEEYPDYPGLKRDQVYDCVGVMVGPEGVQYATYEPSAASPKFVVSADCKNPEVAFRLGDYMVSHDLSNITRWGWPGTHWNWIEDCETDEWKKYDTAVAGAEPSLYIFGEGRTFWSLTQQNFTWMQYGPYIRGYGDANGRIQQPDPATYVEGQEKLLSLGEDAGSLYQESDWRPEKTFTTLMYNTEESDVIADIQATLTTYVEEKTAAFLLGQLDLDKDWDAFLAELDIIGIDTALEINQGVYDRTYGTK